MADKKTERSVQYQKTVGIVCESMKESSFPGIMPPRKGQLSDENACFVEAVTNPCGRTYELLRDMKGFNPEEMIAYDIEDELWHLPCLVGAHPQMMSAGAIRRCYIMCLNHNENCAIRFKEWAGDELQFDQKTAVKCLPFLFHGSRTRNALFEMQEHGYIEVDVQVLKYFAELGHYGILSQYNYYTNVVQTIRMKADRPGCFQLFLEKFIVHVDYELLRYLVTHDFVGCMTVLPKFPRGYLTVLEYATSADMVKAVGSHFSDLSCAETRAATDAYLATQPNGTLVDDILALASGEPNTVVVLD